MYPRFRKRTLREREHLFGDVIDGRMYLNELGDIADRYWRKLSVHHPNIEIEESIIMPNHPKNWQKDPNNRPVGAGLEIDLNTEINSRTKPALPHQ